MSKKPDQQAVRMACVRIAARCTKDPGLILRVSMLLAAFIEGADATTLATLSERIG